MVIDLRINATGLLHLNKTFEIKKKRIKTTPSEDLESHQI